MGAKGRAGGGSVAFIGSFPGEVPATGLPEIAFAGRSNVGKSSAINTLLGVRGAARVSGRPGRTQAINLFRVDDRLCFVDLPGYGFARVPEAVRLGWKALVEGYLGERDALRLVVVLVDARLPAQDLDRELIAGLDAGGLERVVVATKADKLSRSRLKPRLAELARQLGEPEVIPFSSRTRMGVDALWARIRAAAGIA